jgi:hypothetical protein
MLTGQSTSRLVTASRGMTRVTVTSTDCDHGHEQVVYLGVPAAKVHISQLAQFNAFTLVTWYEVMLDQVARSTTSKYEENCRASFSARTLRAQLQVFLI